MAYAQEQLTDVEAKTQLLYNSQSSLKKALRQVLNSTDQDLLLARNAFKQALRDLLSNYYKAEILMELENDGECNPEVD